MNLEEAEAAIVAAYKAKAPSSNGQHATLEFGPDTRLPDEFWNTPIEPLGTYLRHIRQAALAQLVAPTAVLGAVLARISAASHHELQIPAIIATSSPLCMFCLIIGDPGSGKGAATGVASELLPNCPLLDPIADGFPIGSDQGLIEVMYGSVPDPDKPRGKPKREQVRHNAYPQLDEGLALAGLGDGGTGVLSTTCTLWSGKTAGRLNATAELQRVLPPASYTYGIVIDIQPENAALILTADQLGAPQRYLFLAAAAPEVDDTDVEFPGPLKWGPPLHHDIEHLENDRNHRGWARYYLTVDQAIVDEVRTERRTNARRTTIGTTDDRRLNEHRFLLKLRIAGLFSLMQGTFHISPDLWALAEHVLTVSCTTRALIEKVSARVVARNTEKQGRAQGYQDIARRHVVEDADARHMAERIVGKIRDGTTVRRDVAKRLHVKTVDLQPGIDWGIEHEWLTTREEPNASPNGKPSEVLTITKTAPK